MKGCYALVYRRQNEKNSSIPDVPEHLLGDIASKLEEEFIAQTSATTELTLRRKNTVEDYHKRLTSLFSRLQVKKGEEFMKNPEDVVFLPTELFSSILMQEFSTMVESNEEAESKMSFPLCVHNQISLESVRNGLIKAVNKQAALRFLEIYDVEYAELKTGFVSA
ncbi:unnamed protein product [Gongylonema pulchrum]|uniref:Retrotransposon gag protein n=1 Tax=Gongylonema pulchrum TaxID=637853 RepID=A0A183EKB3_9BILA|nr:unnamed protein product [Gongylonema pulchrum]